MAVTLTRQTLTSLLDLFKILASFLTQQSKATSHGIRFFPGVMNKSTISSMVSDWFVFVGKKRCSNRSLDQLTTCLLHVVAHSPIYPILCHSLFCCQDYLLEALVDVRVGGLIVRGHAAAVNQKHMSSWLDKFGQGYYVHVGGIAIQTDHL